jgi:siroheme synthase (precorrin-2 oxidase/ferrochelatase)
VGSVAVDLAGKIFGDLGGRKVMILGAGDTSERVARSLVSRGVRTVIVANRTFDRAAALADQIGGLAVHFDHWHTAFDEVDIALLKIHEGTIPDHKNIPTLIQDKTGWNRFLDNFQRGLFPFIILIMTSNKPPQFVNALDPSYLRPGRVDEIFELSVKTD